VSLSETAPVSSSNDLNNFFVPLFIFFSTNPGFCKDTQARIAILTENSAKLEQAANTQKQTIDTLVEDAAKYRELNKELNTKLEAANEYKNTLIDKLRKHDLVLNCFL
jgi:hypothetical protein